MKNLRHLSPSLAHSQLCIQQSYELRVMSRFGVAWNEAVKGKLPPPPPPRLPRNVTTLLGTRSTPAHFTDRRAPRIIKIYTGMVSSLCIMLSSSCNKLHNAPCIMKNVQENRSAKPTELTGVKFLHQSLLTGPKV
jgi:hypothetical protein